MKFTHYLFIVASALAFYACGGGEKKSESASKTTEATHVSCPAFSADSAWQYVADQCAFGPRVPGSVASVRCGDFLMEKFRSFGATIKEQRIEVTRYDGKRFPALNIMASINPECADRVMICSHWDSRPWADHDADEANHHTPILGANDGASGVGVMLELCRLLQSQPATIGVDFVCFDAEDMGVPEWADFDGETSDTWCLGSTAWSEQAAREGYHARYGILLDMVGGKGCTFSREMVSRRYADMVVGRVWSLADELGYSQFFPQRDGGFLTDDHVSVNKIARIPCIDIVPYFPYASSSFGPTWHTMQDTPENIDRDVLKAVGQTLTQLIYDEN